MRKITSKIALVSVLLLCLFIPLGMILASCATHGAAAIVHHDDMTEIKRPIQEPHKGVPAYPTPLQEEEAEARHLILYRTSTGNQGTFGVIFKQRQQIMYSGELPLYTKGSHTLNLRMTEAILPGTYICIPHYSAHLGKTYAVTGVPGRSGILIHQGNWCGDKADGYKCDSAGCILLGQKIGIVRGQEGMINSLDAKAEFIRLMGDLPFTLTIKDDFQEKSDTSH